jgi:hypothetical protein
VRREEAGELVCPPLTTAKLLWIFLVGVAVGAAILFADYPWWDDKHHDFAHTSPFILWATLVCASTALWMLAFFWLLPSLSELVRVGSQQERRELYGRGSELLHSIVALVAIIVLFFILGRAKSWPNYLPGHSTKVAVLTALGALVGLVAASGVWLTNARLKQLGRHESLSANRLQGHEFNERNPVGPPVAVLRRYLKLRDAFNQFLGALGVILGLLVLTTAAQRQTVLAYNDPKHPHVDYGYQLVLVYGLFYTLLVAAVFLPTYLTATTVGNRIRDVILAPVPPFTTGWDERLDKRDKLGSLLGVQGGPIGQFKAGVAILAPLLTSLTALLLK